MSKMSSGTVLAAALLMASVAAASAPVASAHTCAAYNGCDAGNCPDGEEHNHTDYNYIEKDEHCESHAASPPPPAGSCEYFGVTWPPLVCYVLSITPPGGLGDALPEGVDLGAMCQSRDNLPDLGVEGLCQEAEKFLVP